ncbi:NfeD family protein [Guggenheimella bovis]
MDFLISNPPVLWLILAVVLMIIEAMTVALVTIWFVGGALAAMIIALFVDSIVVQIGVFLVASIVLLLLLRPFVKKTLSSVEPTNADRLIGKKGVVTRPSSEFHPGVGRVENQVWTIEAEDNRPLPMDYAFEVISIQGVKLIVK